MGTDTSAPHDATAPYRCQVTPHRSLSPTGFLVLMALISAISFVTGILFLMSGAWPVPLFLGLDVVVIYVAFKLNYRSGRLSELIEIADGELTLLRRHPSGRQERYAFNAYWVRVQLTEARDGRTELRLGSHGRDIVFANFLNDDERRDLLQELTAALRQRR